MDDHPKGALTFMLQGLTLHGVMNALVWTTFFICGFLQFLATRAFGIPLASRTMVSAAPYIQPEWQALRPLVGIGGSILCVSALLYFLNMLLTCVASHAPAPETPAFAEALSGPEEGPAILDCWRPWLVFTAVLLLLAYGYPLVHLVSNTPMNVLGMRVW